MPPNLTGYYRFVSQKNMEDYLQALSNGLTPLPRSLLFPFILLPSCLSIPLRRGSVGLDHVKMLRSWYLTQDPPQARGSARRE